MFFLTIVAAIVLALVLFHYPKAAVQVVLGIVALVVGIYLAHSGQIDLGEHSVGITIAAVVAVILIYRYVERCDRNIQPRDRQAEKVAD